MTVLAQLPEEQLAAARVMVVDDDALVTSSLSAFFSLEMDFSPTVFNDAGAALSYLAEHEPDLVISDFLMPGIDGIQLLRRARELYPEVPRVLLTGYADKENAIKAINEVQLFRYIEKPWENELLRQVVRSGVERIYLLRSISSKLKQLAAERDDLRPSVASLARLYS